MQQEAPKTTILPKLLQAFQSSPHSRQFSRTYTERIPVFVIERQDKNLAYVTDGFHTILALASKMKEELSIHPTNVLCNRFYIFQQKTYLYLHFNKVMPVPEPHQMHPYNPYYYFKERYNQFLRVRQTLSLPNPCEHLELTKWEFALVNINAEGYYAPAIIIHEYRKSWNRDPPKYSQLNCILYQSVVQNALQQYRLDDFKEYYAKKMIPNKFQVSLFYFARNKVATPPKGEGTLIVTIDKDKEILNYSEERQKYIILASNQLEGLCSFIDSRHNLVTKEDSLNMQKKHLIELFNGLDLSKDNFQEVVITKIKTKKRTQQLEDDLERNSDGQSWRSGQESEQEQEQPVVIEQPDKKQVEVVMNQEEESSEEEDPLRNLYMKMIQNEFK